MRLWWWLIRFGFRLLYNELAFTYDFVSKVVSLGAWRCWQRTALKYLGPPSSDRWVLDLAHGTGTLQVDLRSQGFKVVGYDLSPAMGRITQKKLRKHHLDTNHLVRGKAQQLPFADASYDAIVSTFPTHFIIGPETLHEVRRILKANGQFIIVPTARLIGGGLVGKILEGLYRITGQRGEEAFDFIAYLHNFGFTATTHHEYCPHSEVVVIVVHKAG